jgi:hypothetical protein
VTAKKSQLDASRRSRILAAGAAGGDAILDVVDLEVNLKLVKNVQVGKILQLLRKCVRSTNGLPGSQIVREKSFQAAAEPGSSGD